MYQNEMKEGFIKDYLRSRVIQKTTLYGLFRKIESYEKERIESLGKSDSELEEDFKEYYEALQNNEYCE